MDSHDDFGGLHRDLASAFDRRRALRYLAGAGLVGMLGACNSDRASTASSASTPSPTSSTPSQNTTSLEPPSTGSTAGGPTVDGPAGSSSAVSVTGVSAASTSSEPDAAIAAPGPEIPDETGGPFPADGSNGPNVLTTAGVERADLTGSFGDSSGTADGIPIRFDLHVVDATTGAAMPGSAVYVWHCTADGRYSIYEISDENFLRGLQTAGAGGVASFTSVFPGCYPGRWPHAHFEVFESGSAAAAGESPIKTSQLALPETSCSAAFADGRYESSADNLSRLTLDGDSVFRDGWSDQLATVSGTNDAGYTASLLVRV